MSNLDLPTTTSFFKKSPSTALEYQSPSKSYVSTTYVSKSPINADSLSLSRYYELKGSLESNYLTDLERWRVKAQESDVRREIAEKENLRLNEELLYWKTKSVTFNKEKVLDIELQEQLSRSRINLLSRASGTSQELLNIEIDSLRTQLHEKIKEIEEIKRHYFQQEIKTSGLKQVSENQLRTYEAQLNLLLTQIQQKIDQSSSLERDNLELSLSSNKLASVQKEVKEIKSLLDLKQEESLQLKDEVVKSQIENINLRKSELLLKNREQDLLQQIESIRSKIESTRQLKEIEQEAADKAHLRQLEDLKNVHQSAKESLELRKLSYSRLVEEKESNINDLSNKLEEIKQQIGDVRLRQTNVKSEVNNLQDQHQSIEAQREQEVKRIAHERERSVEALKKNHLEEKSVLEGKINQLREDLNSREALLNESSTKLSRSRIEKNQLELERRQLQAQLELKKLQEEELERNYKLKLEAKERVHERTVGAVRSTSQYEKSRLEEQQKALGTVLDYKSVEALEAKERANRYLTNSILAEKKEREKSIEAESWRNTYSRQEREKSRDVELQRELRRSQIESLKRSHGEELLAQELNNSALHNVLSSKNQEVLVLKGTTNSLINQIVETSQAAQQAEIEASVWRSRADLEERQKALSLINKEAILQHELDNIRRSQLIEDELRKSQITNLLSSVNAKDREAANWRESYSRLYTSSSYK